MRGDGCGDAGCRRCGEGLVFALTMQLGGMVLIFLGARVPKVVRICGCSITGYCLG